MVLLGVGCGTVLCIKVWYWSGTPQRWWYCTLYYGLVLLNVGGTVLCIKVWYWSGGWVLLDVGGTVLCIKVWY